MSCAIGSWPSSSWRSSIPAPGSGSRCPLRRSVPQRRSAFRPDSASTMRRSTAKCSASSPSRSPSSIGAGSYEGVTPMNDVFYLTEEQRMIRDLARKVARDRIAPNAARYDEEESYPTESMQALVDAGLFGIWVPEEYGGTDMGCLALALVAEELGWACAGTTANFGAHPLGGLP